MRSKELYELIAKRRTVHRYRPSEIDDALIREALELALMAPNHKFTFPWKFVVCGEHAKSKIYEMALTNALQKAKENEEDIEFITQGVKEKFLNPAKIVAFARRKSTDTKVAHEDYASVACAIQNFTTYLSGCGYDSKWSTGSVSKSEKTYDLLQIDSSEFAIEGLIIVGKNLLDKYPPRRRPKLSEVTSFLD